MKKIIWFVFLGMIMIVQPVCAQNKVTEQQKKDIIMPYMIIEGLKLMVDF